MGDDEHRKAEAIRLLQEAHLDPAARDFNLDILRGDELELEHLASVVATPPMMADFRVVVVRQAEALASSPRARELLTDLTRQPPPGLALILAVRKPPRSKARFYKDLESGARTTDFTPLSADDAPGWLMEEARARHGVELSEGAARGLVAALGTELPRLSHEVEKLATLVGEEGTVTEETVERAGTRLLQQDRWGWFDQVGERRFQEALGGLRTLLTHGENGVGLTIGLGTHLLRIGVALDGGRQGLGRLLPPHQQWLISRYLSQSRGWSREALSQALEELREVDRRLKSDPLPDEHHLEWWLLEQLAREEVAA